MGGLDRVWISVNNLEQSLAFYRDFIGLTLVQQGPLDQRETCGLAGQAGPIDARAALLKNQTQSTMIALVEFRPGTGVVSREGAVNWAPCINGISFMVGDLAPTYEDIVSRGFQIMLEPLVYAPFGNKVTILVHRDPDGVMIACIEKTWDDKRTRERFYGMAGIGQLVTDLDEINHFYCGILGLDFVSRTKQDKGALDKVYGLPDGS
jgi:catechol 2,3-dioxygenase-like lactoylglutathione lyase family enzyme